MSNKNSQRILGIDPGTNILGFSVIEIQGKSIKLIEMSVLKLGKIDDMSKRMKVLFDTISNIIDKYQPEILSIEAPFFGKNVQSMLKLGRAQGLCIAAALSKDIPFYEYSPRKIKQSITGNGASSKEQVALMLQRIIEFETMPKDLDATDALAAAVCHSYQKELEIETEDNKKIKTKKSSSWSSFVINNPEKVK
ncbi:MAG: crossover junction endodeoxyribonuclease RuvC [Bacteroidales bacterium]|jgi:crossover junction endodeoxyribonuclease RuvC|nr:crossover junction endodeoxyribonuclease RuvC [Bacteroidales bacterium]